MVIKCIYQNSTSITWIDTYVADTQTLGSLFHEKYWRNTKYYNLIVKYHVLNYQLNF